MFKKLLKFVLYGVAILFILFIGLVIFIPVDSTDSEEDVDKVTNETSAESIYGSVYYHQPSGWRFIIPEGWQVQDAEVSQKLYQESKELIESSTGETARQSAKPSGELALIFSPGNTLNYKYQEWDKKRFPEFEQVVQFFIRLLSDTYQNMAAQEGDKLKFERSKANIGGILFDTFHFTIFNPQTKNVLLTSQLSLAEINGLMAWINFNCTTEEICSTIDAAVGSSLFESMLTESRKLFYSAVKELDNNNNPLDAYNLISQAIELEPNHPLYHIVRADAASRMEGYTDSYINDLDIAEQLAPQLQNIYHLRATSAQKTGNVEHYYLNLHKSNLFKWLQDNNQNLPPNTFGMTEKAFHEKNGKIGYIQSGLTLDFQETLPIPKVGEKAIFMFNKLEIVDELGTVACSDNLPNVFDGYEVTAYNLLTAFEDSSGGFYQLYYQVKYKGN